jgi:acetolactate synthase small subunit
VILVGMLQTPFSVEVSGDPEKLKINIEVIKPYKMLELKILLIG